MVGRISPVTVTVTRKYRFESLSCKYALSFDRPNGFRDKVGPLFRASDSKERLHVSDDAGAIGPRRSAPRNASSLVGV